MLGTNGKPDKLRGPHGGHPIYGRANPMDLIEGIEVLACPVPPQGTMAGLIAEGWPGTTVFGRFHENRDRRPTFNQVKR